MSNTRYMSAGAAYGAGAYFAEQLYTSLGAATYIYIQYTSICVCICIMLLLLYLNILLILYTEQLQYM